VWNEGRDGDGQGLAAFFRFGAADARVDEIKAFWSAGLQYQGLLPGRDKDVAAVGFATARLSQAAGAGFTARHETVIEVYYNAQVAPWLSVTPSVQYIANPGGAGVAGDTTILGLRVLMAF
jgi:porin